MLTARIRVTNVGQRRGDEVVQVYLSDLEASVPVPRASLVGFGRLPLEAGASGDFEITLGPESMRLVDQRGRRVLEPGRFALTIGGASPGERAVDLGAARPARALFTVE